MASIIEKRLCLHKQLENQQQKNNALESQISHLQALANIGTTMCMVAHEINNLLTPLTSYAALALKNPEDKPLLQKALQQTIRNCEKASGVMESMLTVANGETEKKKSVKLAALIRDVFACLCRDFAKDGITVETKIAEELSVRVVPVQIQQVMMNLILNARDAMLPGGGTLTIESEEAADTVQIEVRDSGCGIEPDDLKKIFEPFFTTKAEKDTESKNSGAGLGLGFCKNIIDMHRGSISVESEPAKGTTFRISLPKN